MSIVLNLLLIEGLGTLSMLELLWLLLVVGGLVHTAGCYRDSLADLRALRVSARNGSAMLLASNVVSDERGAMLVQALFFILGVVAGLTPPLFPQVATAMAYRLASPLIIMAAEVLLVQMAHQRRDVRRRVLDLIADEDERVYLAAATNGILGGLRKEDHA